MKVWKDTESLHRDSLRYKMCIKECFPQYYSYRNHESRILKIRIYLPLQKETYKMLMFFKKANSMHRLKAPGCKCTSNIFLKWNLFNAKLFSLEIRDRKNIYFDFKLICNFSNYFLEISSFDSLLPFFLTYRRISLLKNSYPLKQTVIFFL